METTVNRNTATILQLSAFGQYFFPFGNFILPAIIWSLRKNDSKFVDYNGKQALNFQLSMLIYTFILGMIALCSFIYTLVNAIDFNMDSEWVMESWSLGRITGAIAYLFISLFIFALLKVFEFALIIYASVKNSRGENYKFPLTINFLQ